MTSSLGYLPTDNQPADFEGTSWNLIYSEGNLSMSLNWLSASQVKIMRN
jgi:hypothetical protein